MINPEAREAENALHQSVLNEIDRKLEIAQDAAVAARQAAWQNHMDIMRQMIESD
jgi:hypothetical protein